MSNPENPKQAPGRGKFSMSVVPPRVLAELAVAMMEGAIKYGPYNWRGTDIYYSDYYNAAKRHLMQWHEGEDNDPDSGHGLSHVTKAIASLVVLRDAMMVGTAIDDRPYTHHKQRGSTEAHILLPGEKIIQKEPWYVAINNSVKTMINSIERLSK